jgi:PAS domain S-box-containing protein
VASASLPRLPDEDSVRARVLIVDDNVELVGSLHAVLMAAELADGRAAANSIEVVTASRGDEGFAIARSRGFDVAIVDVKLPDTSGVDLIPKLRQASPFGEVILITGFATMDAAMGALRSGAYAFIPKSFRPEELVSTVEQALAKVRLARGREELERRYRALVELTDVLVVGLDPSDCVALFNRKASMLAGVEPSAAAGKPFIERWIPDEDRIRMREAIAMARADRTQEVETGFVDPAAAAAAGPSEVRSRERREAPTRRRVRWHWSKARGGADDPALVYGFGIDVTERRALEKRAADAEALSAMARLALNLAHEIRNPLNAAVLQLHLLGRHVDRLAVDEESRAALRHKAQIVGDEINRLSRLLTEFLDLARPRGPVRELVHLGKLVDDVLDLEQGSFAARGVVVERQLEECALVGDPEKLKQVVLNLVMNALDAMKDGGVLRVAVASEGENARLMVADTGTGIDPAALAQVFDPFFTTKEAGTGLGLSIVRKIVDQHRGDVRIESELGAGTRVTVIIPRGKS